MNMFGFHIKLDHPFAVKNSGILGFFLVDHQLGRESRRF